MDPNQQGQSNAGAPSAPNSGANAPATGASTPSAGTPAAGTPPPVFSGAGAQVPGASVTPGPTVPATPTATPAGSSARRFFGASNRPGSAASAGQPASGIYSGNPTPGIITSAPAASGAAGGKKLSKGMIVGIIVIAVLAIVAVVVGVIAATGGNRSSESESSQSAPVNMSELKTAYNNLANYIAFGDENTSEIKTDDGKTYKTYDVLVYSANLYQDNMFLKADQMLKKENSIDKAEYFNKLDQLYGQLPESLSSEYNIDTSDIYSYYHGFSTIGVLSESNIVERYNTEGLELTRNYIEKTVVTNSDDRYVKKYAGYLRDYDMAFLDVVNDVKVNNGCTVDPSTLDNCNFTTVASYEAYKTAQKNLTTGEANEIISSYQKAAVDALLNIYTLLYGEPEESTR